MRRKLPGIGNASLIKAVLSCAVVMLGGPLYAQGDVKAGRLKADTCMGCHGIPGYTNVYPTYHVPKLGGQHAEYIVAALQAYKAGLRDHDTMQAQAAALSSKDMEDIAAWFESMGEDVPATPAGGGGGQKAAKTSGGKPQQQAKAAGGSGQQQMAKSGAAASGGAQAGGQQTYAQVCSTCHDAGTAGAPKLTDKIAWQPRIKQGKQTLYKHAISGLGAMPPKGGQASLSNADVEAAVDYIVSEVSGGGAGGQQQTSKAPDKGASKSTKQSAGAQKPQPGKAEKGR